MNEKFKVGDKVKVIKGATKAETLGRPELVEGAVYTVTDASMPLDIKVDNYSWWFVNTRFVKVEDMKDETNGVTLNGVTYRVEYVEGKGECLVPVQVTTWGDILGKIVKWADSLYIVRQTDYNGVVQRIPLNNSSSAWSPLRAKREDKVPSNMSVVAENLSDAIKKGLIK